jgi:hypothetical protein
MEQRNYPTTHVVQHNNTSASHPTWQHIAVALLPLKRLAHSLDEAKIARSNGRGAVPILLGRAEQLSSYLRLRDKHGLDGFSPHLTAQRLPSPPLSIGPIMKDNVVHCVVKAQGSEIKIRPTVRGNARPPKIRLPSLRTRTPCVSPFFDPENEWTQSERKARSVIYETHTQTPALSLQPTQWPIACSLR